MTALNEARAVHLASGKKPNHGRVIAPCTSAVQMDSLATAVESDTGTQASSILVYSLKINQRTSLKWDLNDVGSSVEYRSSRVL